MPPPRAGFETSAIPILPTQRGISVLRHAHQTQPNRWIRAQDAYRLGADGIPRLLVEPAPLIDLDPGHYAAMAGFDARFPAGPPSLAAAESLTVRGDWTFGAGVVAQGAASLPDEGRPARSPTVR